MRSDSGREFVVSELLTLRRQPGPFATRLAYSTGLITLIGGGNLRYARQHLEKIRRSHAHEPDGDIATYFATSGYRTNGDTLEKRLENLAKRHHVSDKTILRRSDRGAVAIAQLIRHEMRYERPWAYLLALQNDDSELHVRITFLLDPTEKYVEPAVYLNGSRVELSEEVRIGTMGWERHIHRLEPIPLDLEAVASDEILRLLVGWATATSPIWDIATRLTDNRLYSRHTFDAVMPNVQLQILRWDDVDPRSD